MADAVQIQETTTKAVVAVAQPAQEAKAVQTQAAAGAKQQKKKPAVKKTAKKAERVVMVKSKRKTAIARASIKKGSGRIRINGFDVSTIEPMEFRNMILEPLGVSATTEELAKGIDINILVNGGGRSAQAQAARGAIAKGISEYSGADIVKKGYMHYDRSMLVDDPRRVEPKKFGGPKARARVQKSYR
jgi:small subunit ribosomal protein S9